jgi:hypothetical protein
MGRPVEPRLSSAQRDLQRHLARLPEGNCFGPVVAEAIVRWLRERTVAGLSTYGVRPDRLLGRRRHPDQDALVTLQDLEPADAKTAEAHCPYVLPGVVEISPELYGALLDESAARVRTLFRFSGKHLRLKRGCATELLAALEREQKAASQRKTSVGAPTPAEVLAHLRNWDQRLFSEWLKGASRPEEVHKQLRDALLDGEPGRVIRVQMPRDEPDTPGSEVEALRALDTPVTIFAVPCESLLAGYSSPSSEYDAVVALVEAWQTGAPLGPALGTLARRGESDAKRQQLLADALALGSREALEALCVRVVGCIPRRRPTLDAQRLAAVAAVANPKPTAAWLEAVRSAVREGPAVRTLFRRLGAGDLIEEEQWWGRLTPFFVDPLDDAIAPPQVGLEERFGRGLREALEPKLALECLVSSAELSDPAAVLVALCAEDKRSVFRSARVRGALAEAIVHFGGVAGPVSACWSGFCMSRRDCHRAAMSFSNEIEFQALADRKVRVTDAAVAIFGSARARQAFWVWQPVPDSVEYSLRNALRDRTNAVGTEQVRVEYAGGHTSALRVVVEGHAVAELHRRGLSVAPRERHWTGERTPELRDGLRLLCQSLGEECAAGFLALAQHVGRRQTGMGYTWHLSFDQDSPCGLAAWAAFAKLPTLCERIRTKSSSAVEQCILVRALGMRLLRERGCMAVDRLVLSPSWESLQQSAGEKNPGALKRLLWLEEHLVPESEGADLVARGLRLVARGWLTNPRPLRHNRKQRPTHSLAEHAPLPTEDALVLPRLDSTSELLRVKTLARAADLLNDAPSLEALLELHNDLDYVGAEVRRRLVSQAALLRAFGAEARDEDLASFVLARGGLAPAVSVGLVETVVTSGALAGKKRQRRE